MEVSSRELKWGRGSWLRGSLSILIQPSNKHTEEKLVIGCSERWVLRGFVRTMAEKMQEQEGLLRNGRGCG